jgi:hypothetical protein
VILDGLAEAGFARPHRHVVQAIMSEYTGAA